MYIPVSAFATVLHRGGEVDDGRTEMLLAAGWPWLGKIMSSLGSIFLEVVASLWEWWQALASALSDIFENPGAWCVYAIRMGYSAMHHHPQVVCFMSLCLFLGPMVLLLPFMLAHEIIILFLFNLSFVTHGLVPGRVEDQYDAVKERFVESKEMVFASVDSATATFNQWTTDHILLRLLRIAAGVTGVWTLCGLWVQWTQTQY